MGNQRTITANSKTDQLGRPYKGPLLGDRIAAATKAVGIKPCGGCKKRQAWLNEKHQQWRDRHNVEEV